jgi:HK97 family phage major capsid protein
MELNLNLFQLREEKNALQAKARALLESIDDQTPEAEARQLEADFDAMTARSDRIGENIQRLERAEASVDLAKRPVYAAGANLAEARILTGNQSFEERAAARGADRFGGLDVGGYLRAALTGAQNETERRALSIGTNSAGGYTVPTILSAQLIDGLRAASVVQAAGAQFVPMPGANLNIAKVLSDPVAGFRLEEAAVAIADPTFGMVALAPKSLAVLVKVSRELLADSVNLASELPALIARAMAARMDEACLIGTGADGQPEGLINISGINSASLGGALASYAPLIAARTSILSANAGTPTAIVMHPREAGTLAGLTATDNQPLMAPAAVASIPMLTTTALPIDGGAGADEGTIVMGDFTKLLVGVREELSIQILTERYADTGQAAFLAHMRFDVAATHAAAFHVTDAING